MKLQGEYSTLLWQSSTLPVNSWHHMYCRAISEQHVHWREKQSGWSTFKDLARFVELPEQPCEVWPGFSMGIYQPWGDEIWAAVAFGSCKSLSRERYLQDHMVLVQKTPSGKGSNKWKHKVPGLALANKLFTSFPHNSVLKDFQFRKRWILLNTNTNTIFKLMEGFLVHRLSLQHHSKPLFLYPPFHWGRFSFFLFHLIPI